MIRYLKHNQIDKATWDDCINKASNSRFYALSWFLDIVSPGWGGLVENAYESVFPVPKKKKYGVPYLIQPVYLKYIDIYSKHQSHYSDEWFHAIHRMVNKFGYVNIFLADAIKHALNHDHEGSTRGQELDLSNSFDHLKKHFSKNITKNVKQAIQYKLHFYDNISLDAFLQLKATNYAAPTSKQQVILLHEILERCSDGCERRIFGIKNEHDELLNAVALIFYANRIYILSSATTREARDKKVRFYMNQKIIEKYANSKKTLDFMGSNIKSIAYFNKGFGARDYYYHHAETGMLHKLVKTIKG